MKGVVEWAYPGGLAARLIAFNLNRNDRLILGDNFALKATVYNSESSIRHPVSLMREMCSGLIACRGLAWRLFVRNISAQYRQSILGYVWAFVPPLLSMAVWVFLNAQKVIQVEDPGMPYPLFVLTGTVLWQTFVDALNSPLNLFNQSKSILGKINFPHEALIVTGVLGVGFNFLIRLVLLFSVFLWFQTPITLTMVLGCVGAVSLITLGIGLGLLLTPLGALYTDVGRSVALITHLWFFLTPIIYPVPKSGLAALVNQFNPVSSVLVTVREWMILGTASQTSVYWMVAVGSLFLLILGWVFLRVAMPHLIARIGA